MHAKDLIKTTKNTKIYLDMDGVLADFFHEYAKLAGTPADEVGRHDYRNIPVNLREPMLDKMIGTDFFYRLPKFPSADGLVSLVLKYVPTYNICSSPLRGDNANCEKWKRAWIKTNLSPQPSEIIITGMKERHAVNADGSPNILIDDRGQVLERWRGRGGIGIKYQADENSLNIVAKGLAHAYGDTEINMRYKEIIKEAPIDQAIAAAQQSAVAAPAGPPKKNIIARAIGGLNSTLQGTSNALGRGIDKSLTHGGIEVPMPGAVPPAGGDIPYKVNAIDKRVLKYLTTAAESKPLTHATGNVGIDAILKQAQLIK